MSSVGASAICFYIPTIPASNINCEVGAAGVVNTTEPGGNTSFGENWILGGGKPHWNDTGSEGMGETTSCVNFGGRTLVYETTSTLAQFPELGGTTDQTNSYLYDATPWGISSTPTSIGYGVPRSAYNNESKPGLLIIEYVNNKDTIVLTESQTITVPLGVTGALISGCGAGGGKISLTRAPAPGSTGASGAGGSIINYYVPLSAGESIECIIGEDNTSFGDGGDTKFGNYITLGGGKITSATGSVPSGVNLSKDAFVSDGGYTPFGRTSYYDSASTYHEAMGYGAGSNGYEVGEPSSSLPGLLIIQWVK